MALKKIAYVALLIFSSIILHAQDKKVWKNKKCAVVLTYDDAVAEHLDNAIPLLDSLHFKASFYLTTSFPGFSKRVADWRKAAQHGHELGNHCLFHPCVGGTPGREWVKPDYDLSKYSVQRMTDELRMNNIALNMVDGKTKRTFAYPCGDMFIGDSFYLDKKDFVAARSTKSEMLPIDKVDIYTMGCFDTNGATGEQLIDLVKKAMESNTLLVFIAHGVGGGHPLNVSLDAHRKLLLFLKQQEKDIWVTTFIDAMEYVKEYQQKKKP